MKVINLTPHDVNICNEYGYVIKTYKASGQVARTAYSYRTIGFIDDIPVTDRVNERVVNLPEPQPGIMYIVSNIILGYCKDRHDLLAPVEQVKINGRVVGCQAFVGN